MTKIGVCCSALIHSYLSEGMALVVTNLRQLKKPSTSVALNVLPNGAKNSKHNDKPMDTETAKIIQQLADKLGTTVEKLWGALVRQAPIASATDLVILAIALAAVPVTVRLTKREFQRIDLPDDGVDREIGVFTTTLFSTLCAAAFVVACHYVSNLGTILSGFFNPEYWALKQIIK